jgi:hypothetical protein
MKSEKKYRSLSDVYVSESFGKELPILERLKVMMAEQPEKTINVLAQSPAGEPELIGSVDQKGLTKISNIVKSDISTEVMNKLLQACNLLGFAVPISQIFEKYNINYGEIDRLLVSGKDKLNILSHKIIGKDGSINLKELIFPVIQKIVIEQDAGEVEQFFNDVFNLSGAENVVAVGKGEIALILFTEGKKVVFARGDITKGDIVLPDKTSLELKVGQSGHGGRIDTKRGGGFAAMNAIMQELLIKRTSGQNLDVNDILRLKMKYTTEAEINNALPYINRETNPQLVEGLILSCSLVGYAKKGFKYLLMMNKQGATSTYIMNYFDAQDQSVITNAILTSKLGLEVDNEGLTVTTDPVRMRKNFKPKKVVASKPKLKKAV